MSSLAIFLAGVLVSLLCVVFVVVSFVELRRLGAEAEHRTDRAKQRHSG